MVLVRIRVDITLLILGGEIARPSRYSKSYCFHLSDTHAKLRFASSYGDHMVLQKSPAKAMLWGYAPEGTQINISLSGPPQQEATAVADGEG